jgi:hypothetical protein
MAQSEAQAIDKTKEAAMTPRIIEALAQHKRVNTGVLPAAYRIHGPAEAD